MGRGPSHPAVKVLIAIGASTLVLAGCGSDAEKAPRSTTPAAATSTTSAAAAPSSTAGPREHTTTQFFDGALTLTYAEGWTVGEDSAGEFSISSPDDPALRVIIWKDIYPTVPKHGLFRVAGVPSTAPALLAWIRANPNLVVGRTEHTTIGAAVPAVAFDVSLSPDAVNDDPDCPERACVNFLGWTQWGEPYGMAGPAVTRFYLADIKQGTESHLVVAAIEGVTAARLKAGLEEATAIIASIELPVDAA